MPCGALRSIFFYHSSLLLLLLLFLLLLLQLLLLSLLIFLRAQVAIFGRRAALYCTVVSIFSSIVVVVVGDVVGDVAFTFIQISLSLGCWASSGSQHLKDSTNKKKREIPNSRTKNNSRWVWVGGGGDSISIVPMISLAQVAANSVAAGGGRWR